jgi:hypothetical protein
MNFRILFLSALLCLGYLAGCRPLPASGAVPPKGGALGGKPLVTAKVASITPKVVTLPANLRQRLATLSWDANPPEDGVTNYVVASGATAGSYTTNWSTGTATSAKITVDSAHRYFAVAAQGPSGLMSGFVEVFTGAPALVNTVRSLRVFSAPAISGPWTEFYATSIDATNSAQFWKVRLE